MKPLLPQKGRIYNPAVVILQVMVMLAAVHGFGQTLYVKSGATGSGDGSSWANAMPQAADAFKTAKELNDVTPNTITEIWVAGGTYKPLYRADNLDGSDPLDRNNAFVMVPDVKVYGGFAGNETLLAQRDLSITANTSILSGDLNGDDAVSGDGTLTGNEENAYHIIVCTDAGSNIELNGFTIKGGHANGSGSFESVGGGVLIVSSSPVLSNLFIIENMANNAGGMHIASNSSNSYPVISNVTFRSNTALTAGGAVYTSMAFPTFTNVVFSHNTAVSGGGIFDYSSGSVYTNVAFTANEASFRGGAITLQSSLANYPVLTNVTLTGNLAGQEGGALNNSGAFPKFRNSIIWGNTAPTNPNIHALVAKPDYYHSLIEGSGGSGAWNPALGTDNGNNIDAAPQFGNSGTGDYTLQDISPAINAGSDSYFAIGGTPDLSAITTDLTGNTRFYGIADMGAYEYQGLPWAAVPDANGILYVKQGSSGDGSSWANAMPEAAKALKAAKELNSATPNTVTEIWVAGGTYKPLYRADNLDGSDLNHRYNTFIMAPDVKVYGGFAGTEASLVERDFSIIANASTLSGDFNGDDLIDSNNTITGNEENAIHVVLCPQDVGLARLDGFTVKGGNANISSNQITVGTALISTGSGGGMYCANASTVINHLVFRENMCSESGGGMYMYYGSPTLTNTSFTANTSLATGGGLFIYGSSPVISDILVTGNTCMNAGGGIFAQGNIVALRNAIIIGNSGFYGGGVFFNGGNISLTNTVTVENTAGSTGGGIEVRDSTIVLTNVTIANNSAAGSGGGISYYNNTATTSRNCIIWGNTVSGNYNNIGGDPATYSHSLIQGSGGSGAWNPAFGTDSGSNIDVDPLFTDADSGDYTLMDSSPAINAGSNDYYNSGNTPDLSSITVDLAGAPRFYNNGVTDLGPYEFQGPCTTFAPIVSDQYFCGSAIVANLTATGSNILWYPDQTNASLSSGTALATGTYYVTQSINGCESPRTAVSITVTPDVPPTAQDQAFCGSTTVADLVATGSDILWYTGLTGGTALNTTDAVSTGVYYASQTVNNCESSRTSVNITVTPNVPPTISDQAFCDAATVADLTAAGSDILWYTGLTGGTALNSTDAVSTGVYYASQTVNSCESTRASVNITVTPNVPPTISDQAFCDAATVADLTAAGSDILWYTGLTGGTALNSTDAVSTGVYYASQTVNNCESTRASVNITVTPNVPPTVSDQAFCDSATVADLSATGTGILWYTDQTGGMALNTTDAVSTGVYYASQTVNNCESSRISVNITVTPTVPPTAQDQAFCDSATVSDLTATGSDILWYTGLTGGTALNSTDAVSTGIYYASQTVNSCESARASVNITVTPNVPPVGDSLQTIEAESEEAPVLQDLTVTGTGLLWYLTEADALAGTNAVPGTTAIQSGTTYYVTQTIDGCESQYISITVTIVVLGTEKFEKPIIQYFPNPMNDELHITASKAILKVTVHNLIGQKVIELLPVTDNTIINTSMLTSGTYLVKISITDFESTVTIIKQ